MKTIKIKRYCADCGEYNASKTSEYCTFCRDSHPHAFVKPSKELRNLRQNLAAANCHLDLQGIDCEHLDVNACPGYQWVAPINGCGLCRGPVPAEIHTVVA